LLPWKALGDSVAGPAAEDVKEWVIPPPPPYDPPPLKYETDDRDTGGIPNICLVEPRYSGGGCNVLWCCILCSACSAYDAC